jgi:hypothetical protein
MDGGVQTGSTRHVGHFWAIVPAPVIVRMENLVEWTLAGETEVLGETLPQRHFCLPQITLDKTLARTRATAVGNQRLTAWAMARPLSILLFICTNTVAWTECEGSDLQNKLKCILYRSSVTIKVTIFLKSTHPSKELALYKFTYYWYH